MAKFIWGPDHLVIFDGYQYNKNSFALDNPAWTGLPAGEIVHVYDDPGTGQITHYVSDGSRQRACPLRGCAIIAQAAATFAAAEAARGYFAAGYQISSTGIVSGHYYDASTDGWAGMKAANDLVTVGRRVAGKQYNATLKAWV